MYSSNTTIDTSSNQLINTTMSRMRKTTTLLLQTVIEQAYEDTQPQTQIDLLVSLQNVIYKKMAEMDFPADGEMAQRYEQFNYRSSEQSQALRGVPLVQSEGVDRSAYFRQAAQSFEQAEQPPEDNHIDPDIVVNPPDIVVNPPDIVVNPPDIVVNPHDIVLPLKNLAIVKDKKGKKETSNQKPPLIKRESRIGERAKIRGSSKCSQSKSSLHTAERQKKSLSVQSSKKK